MIKRLQKCRKERANEQIDVNTAMILSFMRRHYTRRLLITTIGMYQYILPISISSYKMFKIIFIVSPCIFVHLVFHQLMHSYILLKYYHRQLL